jgi:hypothetical protein
VVAPEEEEVLWELELVAEQQHDALDRILAAVDVVPDEEVVGVARVSAVLEYLQQVAVLTVDVA